MFKFSPHTWRCFSTKRFTALGVYVFSTYVEVFPCLEKRGFKRTCFLHIRGGFSRSDTLWPTAGRFSPHTWRCSDVTATQAEAKAVFSTYVEVFPQRIRTALTACCFLHIRGGVSDPSNAEKLIELFSPRMWGCFQSQDTAQNRLQVFSTYVEVFLELPF